MKPRTEHEFEFGETARLFDAVLRHAGACIKVLDLDGRVVRWSPGCEGLYGWTAEEAIGQVLPHVPEDRRASALALIRSVATLGEIAEHADFALNSEGWKSNLLLTMIPVVDADGHAAGVMSIARESLADERVDRLRESFSTVLGRTLTEPLGTISNAALLLTRPDVLGDPRRRSRLVATIASLAREAASFVDDLRMESETDTRGGMVLDLQEGDVGSLMVDAVAALGPDSHRVFVDFEPGATRAQVDVARVARAFAVLLRNAIASAVPGSMVHASVRRVAAEVAVDVRYEGKESEAAGLKGVLGDGIPPRAGSSVLSREWTGLGLVRAVARAHGGDARARADARQGVTFAVTFPRQTSDVPGG